MRREPQSIKAERMSSKGDGCNFCWRPAVDQQSGYDYDKVTKIWAEYFIVRICDDCLREVLTKATAAKLLEG